MAHELRVGDRVKRTTGWPYMGRHPKIGDVGTVCCLSGETASVVFDEIFSHREYECVKKNLRYIGMRVNPEKL